MTYDIVFDKRVVPELKEIVSWYEKQSSIASEKFAIAFKLTLEILAEGIVDYPAFTKEIKKVSVPGFPYFIYYSRAEIIRKVFVHAILHTKRDKDFISKRLK